MTRATLAEITDVVTDGTHGSPTRTDAGVPVLSAQNVKGGRLVEETTRFTSQEEWAAFQNRVHLQPGDLLLTIVGTIGRAALLETDPMAVFQRSVAIIRPTNSRLDGRYLLHATQSEDFQEQLRRATNQSSQAGIYLGRLKEITVPLPSLVEQRRIAAILDQADALRVNRRQALAHIDDLSRSVFLEMFGDPFRNPRGWPTKSLCELGEVSTGKTPPTLASDMFGGPIPFVTPGDLESGTSVQRTLTDAGAAKSRTVRAGSTFVCCIGNIGKVGRAETRSAFNQQINAIEWGDEIDDTFGLVSLRLRRALFAGLASSTTLPLLRKSQFVKVPLPVPPIGQQREYAAKLRASARVGESFSSQSQRFHELFGALQVSTFAGRQ